MMDYILSKAGADFKRIMRNSFRTSISVDLVLLTIVTVEPKKQMIPSRMKAVHRTSEQVTGAILHEIVQTSAEWEANQGLKRKVIAPRSDATPKSCTLEPEETGKSRRSAKGNDDTSRWKTGLGHKPNLIVIPAMLFMVTTYDCSFCAAEADYGQLTALLWAIALQKNTTKAIRNRNHKLNVAPRTLLIVPSDVQH